MPLATELKAISVDDVGIYDGLYWFRTYVPNLDYQTYTALPSVVKFDGRTFRKMSFNTDTGTVSYKESDLYATY